MEEIELATPANLAEDSLYLSQYRALYASLDHEVVIELDGLD